MDMYKEMTLGSEAIRYIRESLREGKTFARYLLERSDLAEGRVFTFLPVNVAIDTINDFTTGGKLPEPPSDTHSYFTAEDGTRSRLVPKPNTDSCLATHIHAFLSAGPGRMCIFEDALASSSDPWIASATTRLLIFNDEVYHFLSQRDANRDRIQETIKDAKSSVYPPLMGALTFVPSGGDFSFENFYFEKRQTTSDELKSLAERVEKIIVGAYDGESYLIWTKP